MGNPNSFYRPNFISFTSTKNVQCNSRKPGPALSVWSKPVLRDPFPYIGGRHGHSSYIYNEAVKTLREFDALKLRFGEQYALLTHLQAQVIMKLDVNEKLDMSFMEAGASDAQTKRLLENRIFRSYSTALLDAGDGAGKLGVNHKMSIRQVEAVKKLIAKVFVVATLVSMRKDFDHIDLVKNQAGSRKQEAEKLKLVFCMKALIKAQSNNSNYASRLIEMKKKFDEFEAKLKQLGYFYDMEQKISGKTSETKAWKRRNFI